MMGFIEAVKIILDKFLMSDFNRRAEQYNDQLKNK